MVAAERSAPVNRSDGAGDPVASTPTHPVRTAMESGDIEGVLAQFSADLTLRSPLTATPLRGETALRVLRVVLSRMERWECYQEFAAADGARVMLVHARIGGRDVDMAELMRHDSDGKVCELAVHSRPMAGTAAILAAISPELLRHRSPGAARVVAQGLRSFSRLISWAEPRLVRLLLSG